ncbi:MAG: hypothetical protein KAG61_03175 [Bacteriovoracaceae bacterium]|nr:hypothetical protein [Bacteriovoracaceae bacterium]
MKKFILAIIAILPLSIFADVTKWNYGHGEEAYRDSALQPSDRDLASVKKDPMHNYMDLDFYSNKNITHFEYEISDDLGIGQEQEQD